MHIILRWGYGNSHLGPSHTPQHPACFSRRNNNNFVGSADLAEVCTVMSAILVYLLITRSALGLAISALTLLVWRQEGHPDCK